MLCELQESLHPRHLQYVEDALVDAQTKLKSCCLRLRVRKPQGASCEEKRVLGDVQKRKERLCSWLGRRQIGTVPLCKH